jgi:hypothetical protein
MTAFGRLQWQTLSAVRVAALIEHLACWRRRMDGTTPAKAESGAGGEMARCSQADVARRARRVAMARLLHADCAACRGLGCVVCAGTGLG